MASFFEEKASPSNKQPAYIMAEKLYKTLRKTGEIRTGTPDLKKWASYFNKLIKEVGEEYLSNLLDWFLKNFGNGVVPIVLTAKTFWSKFNRIRRSYEKLAPPKLSSDAKTILAKLDDYGWAYGSSADLPRFVQKSLDNYTAFRRKVITFCDCHASTKDYHLELAREAWDQILDEYMPYESIAFVLIWCDFVHTKLHQWEKWDGNLEPWIWSIHNRQTLRALESEFYERGTLRHHFEQYLSLVMEGK